MEQKRDQQPRSQSKAQLVEQIQAGLRSSDYSRALDLLHAAAAEFPDDPKLTELEKLAQEGVQRKAAANNLITESRELFVQQKYAQAIQLLREAYKLDSHNSLARTILANALVEHAHFIVETDWWEAETLVNEAIALIPAHPTAKNIHTLILDRKQKGSVEEWVAQTRKLQASGNLSAALSQIAEGFAVYPREPKLLQLQDAIQLDHSVRRRQARRSDLEDLRRMEKDLDAIADDAAKKTFAERIRAFTVKYSTDGEFLSVANALLHRLESLEAQQKSSTATPESGSTTLSTPPSSVAEALPAAASQVQPGQVDSRQVEAANIPASARPSVLSRSEDSRGKPGPSMPPPEKIPNAPLESPVPAQSLPTALATEATGLMVSAESPSSRLEPPSKHNSTALILVCAVVVVIMTICISLLARSHPAKPVAQAPAPPATSASPAPAPAVPATVASAPIVAAPVLSAQEPATSERSVPSPKPSSDAAAGKLMRESGQSLGTLLVVTGQDQVNVFVNGKLQPQLTDAGQLRVPNLELKDYVVRVSKSGFQDPPQQTVHIRKEEPATLIFNLQPQPQPQPPFASLTIQGGVPGTTVLVDQAPVGTVQPDGLLSVSNVNPGEHTVELRKERFQPRQLRKRFVAGETISLAAADAALEATPSELKINFAPADAQVAIVKAGALPTRVSSGAPLSLAAGTYTLTARTADSFTRSSTLEVVSGQSRILDLSLAPSGMSKWDDPGGWTQEKNSFTRKGGDFVLYGVTPTSGTFVLSAMLIRGRLLQWVVNYTDPKNYVLFQMDDNNFYRAVIRNGNKTEEIIVPDKGDKKSFRTLHIRVSPTQIVHQIKHGDSWTILDRWTQPGTNLSAGKFGFYIPGNDQVALSDWAHYAELNIR